MHHNLRFCYILWTTTGGAPEIEIQVAFTLGASAAIGGTLIQALHA